MGRKLYEKQPVYKYWMEYLDSIVQEKLGISVIEELYFSDKKRSDVFHRTRYTHPAIAMTEFALYRLLLDSGIEPDCILGASLGELVACAAAGIITPTEMMTLITQQVTDLETCCEPGSMLAVIADHEQFDENHLLQFGCELAAINYKSSFVVSGPVKHIRRLAMHLEGANIISVVMPVEYAFHSQFIDTIRDRYLESLKRITFKKPTARVISCCQAAEQSVIEHDHLWAVIRQPVRFGKTIEFLEQSGPYHYIDVGPSGTLANFTKYYLDEAPSQSTFVAAMSAIRDELADFERLQTSYS